MKRIIVVYNSHSSRSSEVKKEVLEHLSDLKGFIVGKYEVAKTDVDDNAKKLAKIIDNGDLVVAAGGDATGVIVANAILKSGKSATLAALPYGNFNDLARTLRTDKFEDVIAWAGDTAGGTPGGASATTGETAVAGPAQKLYPLEIIVDGKFYRYATCYVTIGMTAEAVKLYDEPKMRKTLKSSFGRKIGSYTHLASWYFKNRHKKVFLPEFKLNGKLQPKKTTDYAAVNGRSMARVMKGREDFKDPERFRSETDRLASFWRLFRLMSRSILFRVPGTDTKYDKLEFLAPATVKIQAEGEHTTFTNIKTIEIRKSKKCLKVAAK